ncbi:uncharacterized protein [Haliotis asinina]|uniref:uncharacterized protein n=1 Tax=Haliotis asinina TaxID=109174 RepID=UPI003531F896
MTYRGLNLMVLFTVLQGGKSEDYLVAVTYQGRESYIRSLAGETGGLVEIRHPHSTYRRTRVLGPFDDSSSSVFMQSTEGVKNASIIVSGSDKNINIQVDSDSVFSPLPVSALGTKYILPSSLSPDSSYLSLLIIATHNMSTTVDIFFRMEDGSVHFLNNEYNNGDTLSYKLNPYQTLMIYSQYDLNGTVITSEHSVAVYSGVESASECTVYDQLLPVKHYGREYVVAVDDTKLELQIISEHSHVQITFSSGVTVSTGERRLYNRTLERGDSLHFYTTSPVLVTLSRADGYNSSFTTVPPVHSYFIQRSVWLTRDMYRFLDNDNLNRTLKVLVDRRATVLFKDMYYRYSLTWMHVAGSSYKVGTLIQSQHYPFSTYISSNFPFTVLSFYNGSVHNVGYNLSVEEEVHYSGQTYLMPLAGYNRHYHHIPRILASAGETGGQWQVLDPNSGRVWSRRFNPYNTDYFYPKLHESYSVIPVVVLVRDDDIQIKGGMDFYTSFSPLPVSELGTKYIMSSCLPPTDSTYISVLVIATHSRTADVDIVFRLEDHVTYAGRTYRNEDTLSVRLDRYQTLSLNSSSDMTRTIIFATESIAVFSGTYHTGIRSFATFEQLLPVKHYGSEYVIAINDSSTIRLKSNRTLRYQLQVVTDHSDSSIMFNDGSSVSMGNDGLYHKQLGNVDTFFFNSTRPVMVTLCTAGTFVYNEGFTVVPPVSLFPKQTTQQTPGNMQIVTDQENTYVDVLETDILPAVVKTIKWENVTGTRFKVGTLKGGRYTTFICSSSPFSVLGYDHNFIYNGGYNFRTYLATGTSTPDGSGIKLNTGISTPEGNGIKSNTEKPTPNGSLTNLNTADNPNNATLIVGVVCGIVIAALLVSFIAYVFYIRRTTIPLKKVVQQSGEAPSTPMNIYAVPDTGVVGEGAGDTYMELRLNSTPGDTNIGDSTATYVNVANAISSMNQQY